MRRCVHMLLNVGPTWLLLCVNAVQIEMVYELQIVMTANTVVLCYVASPRTPQEHAAASTVGHPFCSPHAVNSSTRVHKDRYQLFTVCHAAADMVAAHMHMHFLENGSMSKACRAHSCSRRALLTCLHLCVRLYGGLFVHLS